MNDNQISRTIVEGFKSINECNIKLNNLNILIGCNGAGKSNFISIFKMLQNIIDKELGLYVGEQGINSLFYNGRKITKEIIMNLIFGNNTYSFILIPTDDDRLMFRSELFCLEMGTIAFGGHFESKCDDETDNNIESFMKSILKNQKWKVYHFHDTSKKAPVKQTHQINDNLSFATDGRNIAAFLYRLMQTEQETYNKIVKTVGLVAPFFEDFILRPNPLNEELIRLEWKSSGSDIPFTVSQLSDGTIRFICLAILLLQPSHLQPETIIIDEPELGLHPAAITILANIIKTVSKTKQLIISTQSVELLNEFEPKDIIVVDRENGASTFNRLNETDLKLWLEEDYSLGELWKKNILGGRPSK